MWKVLCGRVCSQSLETYEVKLLAKRTGVFQADQARVEMFASPSGTGDVSKDNEIKREARSSTFGIVYVVDANEYARVTKRTYRNWIVFAAVSLAAVFVPWYLWGSAQSTLAATAAKSK